MDIFFAWVLLFLGSFYSESISDLLDISLENYLSTIFSLYLAWAFHRYTTFLNFISYYIILRYSIIGTYYQNGDHQPPLNATYSEIIEKVVN